MEREIEKEARLLYERVMYRYYNRSVWDKRSLSMMVDEELLKYNSEVGKIIEDEVYGIVLASFTIKEIPTVVPTKVQLSNMLHKNAQQVSEYTVAILMDHQLGKKTAKEIALLLYEGYDFRSEEVMNTIKTLPKYIKDYISKPSNIKQIQIQVNKLKTSPLRAAYQKIIDTMQDVNSEALDKAMSVALEEKSRYYANRIAITEQNRAKNLGRGKEVLEDDEVEYVKWRMSSKHPMTDICDYYNELDVGYGKGIVRKEDMVAAPLHPHCLCVSSEPYYMPVKKRKPKEEMSTFNDTEKRMILGSYDNLKKWEEGTPTITIFNSSRPKYPISKMVDVLDDVYEI